MFLVLATSSVKSQKKLSLETTSQKEHRMQWWSEARFGMFIHWGLYSEGARHEWLKNRERLTTSQYQKYFDHFNPDHFNPKKWAREAKAAGMKYAVLTTKHHEGFCLFDSRYTDYKATNTPAGRDLVKEFVDAFRVEGLKVGFYYSLIDWHHPDFTIDKHHPQRIDNGDSADYAKINRGKDFEKYRAYLFHQVRELLTNYGKIDIMWLDFSYPGKFGKGHKDWHSKALLKMIRHLQPGIIVDNRLDLNDYADGYDFETPEQVSAATLEKYRGKTWETCQTFSGSWGYYRDETSWKTNFQLLDLLISSVSNGGNLILNVGPTARGEFDYRAVSHLDSIAYWMHANDRSIYGCTYAPDSYAVPKGTKISYNPKTKRLYLFLYQTPSDHKLLLPGYKGKVTYAQVLSDASEVTYSTQGKDLILSLPKVRPPYEIPVIELMLQ